MLIIWDLGFEGMHVVYVSAQLQEIEYAINYITDRCYHRPRDRYTSDTAGWMPRNGLRMLFAKPFRVLWSLACWWTLDWGVLDGWAGNMGNVSKTLEMPQNGSKSNRKTPRPSPKALSQLLIPTNMEMPRSNREIFRETRDDKKEMGKFLIQKIFSYDLNNIVVDIFIFILPWSES